MAETIKLVSTVQPGEVKEVLHIYEALDLVRKGKWTVDTPPVVRQQEQQQAESKGK